MFTIGGTLIFSLGFVLELAQGLVIGIGILALIVACDEVLGFLISLFSVFEEPTSWESSSSSVPEAESSPRPIARRRPRREAWRQLPHGSNVF
jgi:hypothetical protein